MRAREEDRSGGGHRAPGCAAAWGQGKSLIKDFVVQVSDPVSRSTSRLARCVPGNGARVTGWREWRASGAGPTRCRAVSRLYEVSNILFVY